MLLVRLKGYITWIEDNKSNDKESDLCVYNDTYILSKRKFMCRIPIDTDVVAFLI